MADGIDAGEPLTPLRDFAPTVITDTLLHVAQRAGAIDLVAYLVDFEQRLLQPVPDRSPAAAPAVDLPVEGTPAGRAFSHRRTISERRGSGSRVWTPIMEGSECTGVLELTLKAPLDVESRAHCEELGMLAGAAIAIAARYTDLYHLVRRRKQMSLPATLQWERLPPLRLRLPEVTSTGILEPAYDVAGDSFDHAVNGNVLDVAIMDSMGHGLSSSLVSSLAIGSYRHDRRDGLGLEAMHRQLDEVLAARFDGAAFVTGQLAKLDLGHGTLTWVNAGHPGPLHIREGRVRGVLRCRPSLPWGLGSPLKQIASEQLRPGDCVLFYTDGLVEGRSSDGEPFGVERLADLIDLTAGSTEPLEGLLPRLVGAVLDHQEHRLSDDATAVCVRWDPR